MTREEMEDIWENKPYGYFKNIVKTRKKLNKYKVRIRPYAYIWYDAEDLEVLAKNINDSYDEAKKIIREKYKGKNIDGFSMLGSYKCV